MRTLSLPRWMLRSARLSIALLLIAGAIFLYHPYQSSFHSKSRSSLIEKDNLDHVPVPQRVFDHTNHEDDDEDERIVEPPKPKVEAVKPKPQPKPKPQEAPPVKPIPVKAKQPNPPESKTKTNGPRNLPWIDAPPPSTELPSLLITSPHSPEVPYVKHPHSLPYPGSIYHLSSSVHPIKHIRKSEYVLSSLFYIEQDEYWDWVGKMVQARLPPVVEFIGFTCEYTVKKGGEELYEDIQGLAIQQGRHEYVLVECPLPEWVSADLDTKKTKKEQDAAMELLRKGDVIIRAWADLGDVTKQKTEGVSAEDPHLLWRKDAHKLDLSKETTTTDDHGGVQLFMINHTIHSTDWKPSPTEVEHVKLGICVSPVRLQPNPKDDVTRLKDYVEWRIWHMYQGVGAVHWYARDPKFGIWVDRLNNILGLNDTYMTTPQLSDQTPAKAAYADQAVWIEDCLVRYGFTDEWQAHIDLDEYMYPRFDPNPYGTIRRLDRLADNVASFAADHTYYGGKQLTSEISSKVPKVEEFSHFPRNAYTHWDTLSKHDGFRRQKSMHRTAGATLLWVHGAAGLGNGYRRVEDDPVPAEIKDDSSDKDKGKGTELLSNLEILHDRRPMPQALTFEVELEGDTVDRWSKVWEKMAVVLRNKDLKALYDIDHLWGQK